MTRRERTWLTAGAAAAAAFGLFAFYVAYADKSEAILFFCNFTRVLRCSTSLTEHASALRLGPVAVVPALAAAALLQAALSGAAWCASGARRDALFAWAAAASAPLAALGATLLLNDWLVAHATTLAGIYLFGFGLFGVVLAVRRRFEIAAALGRGGWTPLACLLFALLCGILMQGAGSARLAAQELRETAAARPPEIRWPRFALEVPRQGGAVVGPSDARIEGLMFVDLSQSDSRRALSAAFELRDDLVKYGARLVVLAAPPHDSGVAVAQAAGAGETYLRHLLRNPDQDVASLLAAAGADPKHLDDPTLGALLERRARAVAALDLPPRPCLLTSKGALAGERMLGQFLAQARAPAGPPR
jgi:hypothetical protein